jgi:hypothetical protein
MPTDLIRYDLLVQDALRSVVRRVLSDAARNGLPGEHHFNISFKTHATGVGLPAAMRQKYPDEMTIILQHEFWDLTVDADGFEVSLSFSRKPERLKIPFDAIVGFNDPSVPFGFKLEPREQPALGAPAASFSDSAPGSERPQPSAPSKAQPSAPGKAQPLGPPKSQPTPLPVPAKAAPASIAGPRAKIVEAPAPEGGEATKVVSIDAFRKK